MNQKTVLVVDDEADIRDSLRDALSDEGYSVQLAANGGEALKMLPDLPRPFAIILDVIMPEMNGVTFYQKMRALPEFEDINVLISTSDLSQVPSDVPFLKKPVNLDRLLAVVASFF